MSQQQQQQQQGQQGPQGLQQAGQGAPALTQSQTQGQTQGQQQPRKITWTVTVGQGRNLEAVREGQGTCTAVEVWFPGESSAAEAGPVRGQDVAAYDLTATYARDTSEASLNALLSEPLRVVLLDAAGPGDRVVLGVARVPLDPVLVAGDPAVGGWFRALPPGPPGLALAAAAPREGPEVRVDVAPSERLLSDDERARSNFLSVRVKALHSLPAACQNPYARKFFRYVVSYALRTEADELRVCSESLAPAAGQGAQQGAPEEGQGGDAAYAAWDGRASRVMYVGPRLADALRASLERPPPGSTAHLLDIAVRRVLAADFRDAEDPNAALYAGRCSVDLRPLAQPGSTTVAGKGAQRPAGARAGAQGDKRGRASRKKNSRSRAKSRGVVEADDSMGAAPATPEGGGPEAAALTVSMGNELAASEVGGGDEGERKRSKSKSKQHHKGKMQKDLERVLKPETEQHPYDKDKTTLEVEVSLAKPLVQAISSKAPAPPLAASLLTGACPSLPQNLNLADFLPKRKQMTRYKQLREATADYKHEIEQVVSVLASEYRSLFGAAGDAGPQAREERKKMFYYKLNSTAAYFVMKEKLKKTVVRIVNEKFSRTGFATADEKLLFLNELYVFLLDQMHAALSKSIDSPSESEQDRNRERSEQLRRQAADAEAAGHSAEASRYHQQRVALNKSDPGAWYEYGVFCSRAGDGAKADECFDEALVLDMHHAPSLVASACRCFGVDADKTQALLTAVLKKDPANEFAALVKAVALDALAEQVDVAVFARAVGFLVELRAAALAEKVVSRAVVQHGTRWELVAALARVHACAGKLRWAYDYAQQAAELSDGNAAALTLLGEICAQQGESADAISNYRKALERSAGGLDTASGMRLGELLMQAGQHDEAKAVFLRCTRASPMAHVWLCVGRACYHLGQLEEAEQCLAEANMLNNEYAEVWGYLSLVCTKLGHDAEAEQSLAQALKLGLGDTTVLCEIAGVYMDMGNVQAAEKVLKAAAAQTQRWCCLMGDCMQRQGKPDAAVPLYERAVAMGRQGQGQGQGPRSDADYDHAAERLQDLTTRHK
eukprot:m51a1_g8574 hypothetical protein (1067) ;mRNA; r:203518-207077